MTTSGDKPSDRHLTRRVLLAGVGTAAVGSLFSGGTAGQTDPERETSLVAPLEQTWRTPADGSVLRLLGLTDQTLYALVEREGSVRVGTFDAGDGTQRSTIGPAASVTDAELGPESITLLTDDAVHRYRLSDGERSWKQSTDADISRLTVAGSNRIYLSEGELRQDLIVNGQLALLTADGEVEHRLSTAWVPWAASIDAESIVFIEGSATRDDGAVAPEGGAVVRYNIANGSRVWESYNAGVSQGQLLSEGILAYGEESLFLFDTETGKQRRRTSLPDALEVFSYDDKNLYFGFENGSLVALKRDDWGVRWQRSLGVTPQKLTVTGERILAAAGSKVWLLNISDGSTTWSSRRYSPDLVSLAFGDGHVVASSRSGFTGFADRRVQVGSLIQKARTVSSTPERLTHSLGALAGKNELLDQATAAHDAGQYDRAASLVERAEQREQAATAGSGLLTSATLFGVLRYRSRRPVSMVAKRRDRLENNYPIEQGALAGQQPTAIQEALDAEVETMRDARGILGVRRPDADSAGPIMNVASTLIEERERLGVASERLAGLPEDDPVRAAWCTELLERFDELQPEIRPYLSALERTLEPYEKVSRVVVKQVSDEAVADLVGRLGSAARELCDPDSSSSDEALDELAAVTSTVETLTRYETDLDAYDFEPLCELLTSNCGVLSGHGASAGDAAFLERVSETVKTVETAEMLLREASTDTQRTLDIDRARAQAQAALDEADAVEASALVGRLGAIVDGEWTQELLTALSSTRQVEAVVDILTDIGYQFETAAQIEDGVATAEATRWGEDVLVVFVPQNSTDASSRVPPAVSRSTTQIDKVLLVGATDRTGPVGGSQEGENYEIEYLSNDDLLDLLNNSTLQPPLPE